MIGQGIPGEPGSIASSVVTNNGTLAFNRVESLTYAGAIRGPGTVEKQAAGSVTLTGTNDYTGSTTVSEGTLLINGSLGSTAVTVSNATLGGNGLIQGPVIIQTGGRLAPGTSIGTLTISNTLSLSGVAVMELNATAGTNDFVRGLSTVNYGGRLTLTFPAGTITATNTFRLFSANSYSGVFAAFTPSSPGPGLAWNTNTLATDGTLRVAFVVSTTPVTITNTVSGNLLTLSWPADHTGWRLQAQTNPISLGLGVNWLDVPDSTNASQMTFTLDPAAGSVFYRLRYP
jgi:autotransporter-associated beta strand protein